MHTYPCLAGSPSLCCKTFIFETLLPAMGQERKTLMLILRVRRVFWGLFLVQMIPNQPLPMTACKFSILAKDTTQIHLTN